MARKTKAKTTAVVIRENGRPMRVTQIEHIDPPDGLGDVAKEFWRSIVPELTQAAILTTLDVPALVQMAETYAEMRVASEAIKAEGPVIRRKKVIVETKRQEKNGRQREFETTIDLAPIVNPAILAMHSSESRLLRLYDKFGMTPSSRVAMAKRMQDQGYQVQIAPLDLDALDQRAEEEMAGGD